MNCEERTACSQNLLYWDGRSSQEASVMDRSSFSHIFCRHLGVILLVAENYPSPSSIHRHHIRSCSCITYISRYISRRKRNFVYRTDFGRQHWRCHFKWKHRRSRVQYQHKLNSHQEITSGDSIRILQFLLCHKIIATLVWIIATAAT